MANLLLALLLVFAMPAFGSRVTSLPSVLDEEAAEAADAFVGAHFSLECGEDVFSQTDGRYWQYRDFGWLVCPDPVTYKDTVFGVEWKGQLEIGAQQFRTYPSRTGSARQPRWSRWHPVEPIHIYFQKKHGIWNFHSSVAHDELPMGHTAPRCDALPGVAP